LVFDRLADFIIRRHKAIIVAWIIVLIIAIPMAPRINNVLVYDETQMAPGEIESEKAMAYIEQEFGSAAQSGTTIIVLTSADVMNNETKRAIYAVKKELFNASHDGRIDDGVRAESLYTLLTDYATGVLIEMSNGVEEGETLINLTSHVAFGIPIGFQELYWQVNGSAFILYGIPGTHLTQWQHARETHPELEVPQVDELAYNQTVASLLADPTLGGMNLSTQELAWYWFACYTQAWNGTASNITLTADPVSRAQEAMQVAFPELQSVLSEENRQLFLALGQALNLTTWSEFHHINMICHSRFIEGVSNSEDISLNVSDYFDIFYSQWNGTDSAPNQTGFETMVGVTVLEYAELLEDREAELLLSVFFGLEFDSWDHQDAQEALTVDLLSFESESERWVVQSVADLGEDPSPGKLYDLGDALVRNSSLKRFPIPVPDALVDNLVNLPENDTTLIMLTYESASVAEDSVDAVREITHQVIASFSGTHLYVTGSDAISADMSKATGEDLEKIDPVSIVLILVLIGIFFRSVVASSIPPLSIGVAIGIAMAVVYLIGSHLISIHYSVLAVMITAMLGAGSDYCIFILSRYREERRKGRTEEEGVRIAIQWAGEAVTTSGVTVMIGFGSLALGRFALMQSMGISLALGIMLALLVAITLLPSILVMLGDRLFWPAKLGLTLQRTNDSLRKGKGYFERSAKFAVDHAKAIVLAAIVISVPATYLVLTLETSYDFIASMPNNESKQGLEALGEGFGEGRINPIYIAVNFTNPVLEEDFNTTALDHVENISLRLASLSDVEKVISPTRPLGQPIDYSNLSKYSTIIRAQYEGLMRHMVGENGTAVLIKVVLETEPFAGTSIQLVNEIRGIGAEVMLNHSGVQAFYVSGSTAIMYDISEMVQDDFGHMRYLVIIGIYIVLLVVLGSVLIPLRLIITILLSISWTIAVTMLVFIHFVGTPILWLMPMVLFVVCMGLGMDYDILLTTRMREEVLGGKGDREAIVLSVEKTGKVITACGFIMAGAFGTMILSSTTLLQQFGFALAFAILLDAIVVRIYLVPAIMVLLEGYNWWAPGRLQRTDVKGKKTKRGAGSKKER